MQKALRARLVAEQNDGASSSDSQELQVRLLECRPERCGEAEPAVRACHFQERVAVVDEKLGLNFIECEENSEGEVSLKPRGKTEYDSSRAASAHTASAVRCGGLCTAAPEESD
eukprot:COSAG02_NODE_5169_length_4575_cov_2.130920_3_plen_114_part_00